MGSETEVHRTTPTSPDAANAIVNLSESAETFAEPTGTVAEARRQGEDIGSQLDDAAARQARLEQARETMWDAAQNNPGQGVPGLAAQEEETARIADHLVFPGTGVRELKEQGRLEEAVEMASSDIPSPTDNPDRFPPAEWPPKDESK